MSRGGTKVNRLFTMATGQLTQSTMTLVHLALAVIAQSAGTQPPATLASARPIGATMPAQATVRILSGAKVHLGPSSRAMMIKASVQVEDGQRRPAYLIEFE